VDNQITREKIDQFKRDVVTLGYTHVRIAEKMRLEKPNFSSYFNEKPTHPITENFLKRFYEAWGEELEAKKHPPEYGTDPLPENIIEDHALSYGRKISIDDYIDTLQKNNDFLLKNLTTVIQSCATLVNSNEKMADSNYKMVEAHLASMGRDGDKRDSGAGGTP
jgi:hypothetical protein